ncbi:hypothetical protein BGZ60DRAFT_415563 [Tricladium varicosporioides]|nr:hypothetical protein BGZ60DRAFT_415563 [Hymenoscyphus varicosporioides]
MVSPAERRCYYESFIYECGHYNNTSTPPQIRHSTNCPFHLLPVTTLMEGETSMVATTPSTPAKKLFKPDPTLLKNDYTQPLICPTLKTYPQNTIISEYCPLCRDADVKDNINPNTLHSEKGNTSSSDECEGEWVLAFQPRENEEDVEKHRWILLRLNDDFGEDWRDMDRNFEIVVRFGPYAKYGLEEEWILYR